MSTSGARRTVELDAEEISQILVWVCEDLPKRHLHGAYRMRLNRIFEALTGMPAPQDGCLPVMPLQWPLPMAKVLRYEVRRFPGSPRPVMCYWVDSSHLLSFGYDEHDGVLYIEFAGRHTKTHHMPPDLYRWKNVTFELFAGLLLSETKGGYFAAQIKKADKALLPVQKFVGEKWVSEWKGKRP